MTKNLKRSIYIFCAITVFVACYAVGYWYGLSMDNDNIRLKQKVETNNPILGVAKENSRLTINSNMSLLVETVNNGVTTEKEIKVPVEIIGLTRDSFIDYLNEHKDLFASDKELVESIMLVSMTNDRVVLRRYIKEMESETTTEIIVYKYILTLVEEEIVVKKLDDESEFLRTKVNLSVLDEDSIARLEKGINVRNISELYRMLESFTT